MFKYMHPIEITKANPTSNIKIFSQPNLDLFSNISGSTYYKKFGMLYFEDSR